jgi:hypothetical protein
MILNKDRLDQLLRGYPRTRKLNSLKCLSLCILGPLSVIQAPTLVTGLGPDGRPYLVESKTKIQVEINETF